MFEKILEYIDIGSHIYIVAIGLILLLPLVTAIIILIDLAQVEAKRFIERKLKEREKKRKTN